MASPALNEWRKAIKAALNALVADPFPAEACVNARVVFDDEHDVYLVIVHGWKGVKRLHGILAHIEINDGKVWIQQDGTEHGLATDLLDGGIPRDRIVLGFKAPSSRSITNFAVA